MAGKTNKSSQIPYHHGDLRPALIQAARHILHEKGIEALSLRLIAKEIGVSHMAPYAHFKGKQDLLAAVAASGFDELATNMIEAQKKHAKAKGQALAILYGVEYIRFALSNRNLYRLMLSQMNQDDSTGKANPRSQVRSQRPFRLLYSAFAAASPNKKTAHTKAVGAWAVVHGIVSLSMDGHLVLPEGVDAVQLFKTTVGSFTK